MTKNVMDGFSTQIYFQPRESLSGQERLQLIIAHIVYTSIDDAKDYISTASKAALEEALKITKERNSKTLTKLIEAQLRKREREEKKKKEER